MSLLHRLAGRAARLLWRVTKPRTIGVRAVLLDADDRVALVRHTYLDQWYLPGGGVKKGEAVQAALFRELKEETGIAGATIERVLGVYHSRREGKDDHIVIYVARAGIGDRLVRADRLEIAEIGWFPLAALPTVSPATGRRLDEYQRAITGGGAW